MAEPTIDELAAEMIDAGVRRVHVLAWRDLDDPDAGGSEEHADQFMRRAAAAGLEVTHRTSAAVGLPATATRHGYQVVRRGSRYTVFPRTFASEVVGRMGPFDAMVEVWNGVPWLTPVWTRKPRITFLHHVHGPMWDQLLPGPFATLGPDDGDAPGAARCTAAGSRSRPARPPARSCSASGSTPSGWSR